VGALWHPGAIRRIHIDAGGFQGGGRKLVWHTTEGASLPNYGGSAPHFTLDPSDGRLWQHIPLDRAARALMAGGPNFWNTVQVELIGYADTALATKRRTADRAVVNWPDGHYEPIAQLARWIEGNFGVPRSCSVEFVSHTAHLPSLDAVKSYAGHLGHQHVTGNDHWDPGVLRIDLVLAGTGNKAASAAAVPRDLGRGDRGDDVEALQAILVKRGYRLSGPQANGVFGRETEACVVHFQWKHGLRVDGVVGEGTRTALGLELEPPAPDKPKSRAKLREMDGLELGLGRTLAGHVDMRKAGSPVRVTRATPLIAPPRAAGNQLESYIGARPHGGYSDADVGTIVDLYEKTASAVGLDPLLVVAQMILETGNLSSEWSQPPRRNPAGIGVTGRPGEGVSFPSWRAAVRAHVGRLLAYGVSKGGETAVQLRLIDEALRWRPLPDRLRGSAPTLGGLAGTWAADEKYAAKIVRVANEIAKTAA
jgi:Putative peptidoglycan binding domain/Mannosyl-glycoprotein endo-beta-N-acetylglucosaminidase